MALEHDSDSPLAHAVRKAGSQTAFGALIGKRQSVIHDWLREEKPLPAEHVFAIEAATGISRHDLRPDIYPLEETPGPQPGVTPSAEDEFQPAGGVSSKGGGRR